MAIDRLQEKVELNDASEKPTEPPGLAQAADSGDGSATELAPESDDEGDAIAEVPPAEDAVVEAAEGGEAVNGETQEDCGGEKPSGWNSKRPLKSCGMFYVFSFEIFFSHLYILVLHPGSPRVAGDIESL